jgi:hypothetical protein
MPWVGKLTKGRLRKENPVSIIKDGVFIVSNNCLPDKGPRATGSVVLHGIPEDASPQGDKA